MKSLFYYSLICMLVGSFTFCNSPLTSVKDDSFTFTVVDVGQGLSQIASDNDHAIVFDMGPPEGFAEWKRVYLEEGKPFIEAIVISHTDLDHRGGLSFIDTSIRWSGRIVTSTLSDSLQIINSCSLWTNKIYINRNSAGDTIAGLSGVGVKCLWPTESMPDDTSQRNRFSLVYKLTHQNSTVLICSDIDTVAEQTLSVYFNTKLHSDLVIAPHHGSSTGINMAFYGYVSPSYAAVSCARYNSYGHPSPVFLTLMMQLGIVVHSTAAVGTLRYSSNGAYIQAIHL